MELPERTRVTYTVERLRAVSAGILETAGSTFYLLIAVRWFDAGSMAKAVIAAGGSIGLLLSPFIVKIVGSLRLLPNLAVSYLNFVGFLVCFAMALWPSLWLFVIGSAVSMAILSGVVPLFTKIYNENFPEQNRGRLFSRTIMIRIVVAAAFNEIGGRLLSNNLSHFRILLFIFAGCFAAAYFLVRRCPSTKLVNTGGLNPFAAFSYIKHDRVFRLTLICWMFMGFANLMMYPLRVEYLANSKYGISLSVGAIAWIVGVIPNLARLLMSPVWGWLFDKMNFFVLRIILNLGFALGILTFFTSTDTTGLVMGGIVFGVSLAGGDVAWSLWVTKFAPPDRVADYMSVHSFFTGVRGVLAPVVAFNLINFLSIAAMGWLCAALILFASALLFQELFEKKKS
jgi:MFS family permease